jgi:hypothetical protein
MESTSSDWQPDFRATVGLVIGSAEISCDGCGSSWDNSTSRIPRFGGGIRPGVVLVGQCWVYIAQERPLSADATNAYSARLITFLGYASRAGATSTSAIGESLARVSLHARTPEHSGDDDLYLHDDYPNLLSLRRERGVAQSRPNGCTPTFCPRSRSPEATVRWMRGVCTSGRVTTYDEQHSYL